jgi:hypothetical protein
MTVPASIGDYRFYVEVSHGEIAITAPGHWLLCCQSSSVTGGWIDRQVQLRDDQ